MANGFVLPVTTTPQPVPIAPQGSTLVNVGAAQLSLCQTPTFASNVFTLTTKASLPWPSGPLYTKVASGSGSIMLLQGLYNLYNPNIVINSGTITAKIGGTVDVTIKNATLDVTGSTVTAKVTSCTVDATITNATLTVEPAATKTFDVTIKNATLNVNAGVVEVENATGKILTTGGYSERLYASKVKEPHAFSITVTPGGKLWAALMVVVRPLTSGTIPYCAQASIGQYVYQASPRAAITGLLAASFAPGVGGATTFTAIIPVEGLVKTGTLTKIVVGIYTSAASTETYVVMILGLSKNPGVQLRPDGRAYPLGALNYPAAIYKTATDTVTMVSAPTSPLRVFVKSVSLVIGTDTAHIGNMKVQQTDGAIVLADAYQVKGCVAIFREIPDGKLLNPGKGVNLVAYTNSTTTVSGSAVIDYDLVV